jgi:hypothetical protein
MDTKPGDLVRCDCGCDSPGVVESVRESSLAVLLYWQGEWKRQGVSHASLIPWTDELKASYVKHLIQEAARGD